jgi:polar amino acid transport system substrate-binding protein
MKRVPNRRRTVALAGATIIVLAGGCARGADSPASGSAGAIQENRALHERLPQSIRERGALRFATDPSYAPMESYAPDGRTVVGFDADLAAALGAVLGITVEMAPTDFSISLDATAGGRVDGVMSAMTDTVEREKRADFVNYFSAGTSIVVRRGNPSGVTDLDDLCGKAVAVEQSTVQEDLLRRSQHGCGARPIVIHSFKTNSDALLQLRTGRAVALLNDYPPAAQLANDPSSRTHYQLASTAQYEPGFYGIAVAKSNTALRDALHDALGELMRTGAYGELLRRWGLTTGGLPSTSINAAGGAGAPR